MPGETHISRKIVNCPSCNELSVKNMGAIAQTNIFAGRELDFLFPPSDLFLCTSCDLFFKFPQIDKEKLDKLYEQGASMNWQYSPSERNDWRLAKKWIDAIPDKSSVLDIGCFDGQLLSSLASDLQCFGVEVHEEAARRAENKGISIIGRDLSEIDEIDQLFDIVIATDVIEHVHDPLLFLKNIARITRRNGVIIVSTGNTRSLSCR